MLLEVIVAIVIGLTCIIFACRNWCPTRSAKQKASAQAAAVSSAKKPVHEIVTAGDVITITAKPKFGKNFHSFMQRMMKTFQLQRKDAAYEFAVLFLSSDLDIEELNKNMKFENDCNPYKPTDCNSTIFPPDDQLVNYVTARPKKAVNKPDYHAECLLLCKLNTLMECFGELNCKTIVLYTWLLPCDIKRNKIKDCKTAIIEKLGPLAKNKQVILVYTTKWSGDGSGKLGITKEKEEEIVQDIEKAGIIVQKERYYETLSPV